MVKVLTKYIGVAGFFFACQHALSLIYYYNLKYVIIFTKIIKLLKLSDFCFLRDLQKEILESTAFLMYRYLLFSFL